MTKIIDKRTDTNIVTYAIGDWVWYTEEGVKCLCVFTQTSGGMVQLIAISNDDANRCGDACDIHEERGTHKKLSDVTIRRLTNHGNATIEKVNVSIEITNHNS